MFPHKALFDLLVSAILIGIVHSAGINNEKVSSSRSFFFGNLKGSMRIKVTTVDGRECELDFAGPRIKMSELRSRVTRALPIDPRRCGFSHRGHACDESTVFTADQFTDGSPVIVFDHAAYPEKSFPRVDRAFQFGPSRFAAPFVDDSQQSRQEELLVRLVWPQRLHRGSRLLPDIDLEGLRPDALPFGAHFAGDGSPGGGSGSESDDRSSSGSDGDSGSGSGSGERDLEADEYEEEEDGGDGQGAMQGVVVGELHGRLMPEWRALPRGRVSDRLGALNIRVAPEDDAVIWRLMQVGIDRATVLQVYEFCNRDENAAMNCLLSMT